MLELFNNGGWAMYPILLLLIFGVGVAIERLINLSRAHIDARAFFAELEQKLENDGPDQAAQLCAETKGPVASVIHAGLLRLNRGTEHVEKTMENAGAVEMAFLEKGMVWLSTVANLAPMIGFLGTVSGMISAFQSIAEAGDVEPSVVAGGISEALITTASGLMVGIIIQLAYNFFASRIDAITADLQEYSGELIDVLAELTHSGKLKLKESQA